MDRNKTLSLAREAHERGDYASASALYSRLDGAATEGDPAPEARKADGAAYLLGIWEVMQIQLALDERATRLETAEPSTASHLRALHRVFYLDDRSRVTVVRSGDTD